MRNIDEILKRVKVVSAEEAEKADVVVCGPTSHFGDDIHTFCSRCGTDIVHRPYVPKKPPKVCMECATKMSKESGADDVLTRRTH